MLPTPLTRHQEHGEILDPILDPPQDIDEQYDVEQKLDEPPGSTHTMARNMVKIAALFLLGIGGVFLVFGVRLWYVQQTTPPVLPVESTWLSSVGDVQKVPITQTQTRTKQDVVYGFVPYWTVKDVTPHPQLTHIGYFGLPIDKDGNFTKSGEGAQGWRVFNGDTVDAMRTQAQAHHQKFEVLITMMDADEINSFLRDTDAQANFYEQIKTFIKSQPVDGLNIDIEYVGDVDDTIRNDYTQFIKNLRQQTQSVAPNLHLSIDVFADSALKRRVWDISALAPYLDHIVIMDYDFYRSSSPQAGPVAPIFGAEQNRWDIDIVSTLKPFLDQIAPEKLLLGVPFYGYEWRVTAAERNAYTYPNSGGLATYKRVQTLLQTDPTIKEQWDGEALSPYLIYQEKGKTYEIYYENSRSLSYKLDMVNELGMGGIAIWAVGYEGNAPELWTVIQQKLLNTSYTY